MLDFFLRIALRKINLSNYKFSNLFGHEFKKNHKIT